MAEHPEKIPPRASADELLPPVEPPSGAFLMQLFVIPAVIVAGIVGIWMLINSLARNDQLDPQEIVARLRSQNPSRFQVGKDLADMLRMPERYPEVAKDGKLAAALGGLLDEMVAAKDEGDASVSMRTLLTGALGQFSVTDGLPALLNAAEHDVDPAIRRTAVHSLLILAQMLAERDPPQALDADGLPELLIAAANQPDDDLLRGETAYALGVLANAPEADSRYVEELVKLLDDFYPDARYNAATGLARMGNLAAVDVAAEMLDLDAIQGSLKTLEPIFVEMYANLSDERREAALARAQDEKRDVILKNGMQAARTLREKNPEADLSRLVAALDEFLDKAPQVSAPHIISKTLIDAARQVRDEMGGE